MSWRFRRQHGYGDDHLREKVCKLCAAIRADAAHAVLTMVPKPVMGMGGYASVSERVLPWRKRMKVYPAGWYTAYPLKRHRGGRCIYCLATFQYLVDARSDFLPETGDHEIRRLPVDEEVVYGLERRQPDFARDHTNFPHDDHNEWRNAKADQAKRRQRMSRAKNIWTTGDP